MFLNTINRFLTDRYCVLRETGNDGLHKANLHTYTHSVVSLTTDP